MVRLLAAGVKIGCSLRSVEAKGSGGHRSGYTVGGQTLHRDAITLDAMTADPFIKNPPWKMWASAGGRSGNNTLAHALT